MSLYMKQLNNLLTTMKKVSKVKSATLEMNTWITEAKKENHFCNTAACVCGYQAISGVHSNFKDVKNKDCRTAVDVSMCIATSLDKEEPLKHLSETIYSPSAMFRKSFARNCHNLFTEKELSSFNHLNNNKITPADVIEYIEAVIKRLKELKLS